ncbi:hypothetical protein, partial [Endozoicomonas sp. YOMI1]|uniref:hypothetical protein n=1 Tax=Endozoicomonas sp. YOMI1 TaxID=2828739 RepID=UPI0021497890
HPERCRRVPGTIYLVGPVFMLFDRLRTIRVRRLTIMEFIQGLLLNMSVWQTLICHHELAPPII